MSNAASGDAKSGYKPLPDFEAMTSSWADNYDESNYNANIAGGVLLRTHALLEKDFDRSKTFAQVLEIGAGTMIHFPFVRHGFVRYLATDRNERLVAEAKARDFPAGVEIEQVQAGALPYADESFDRVIATHVLEHVPHPHEVLAEWVRVLRPGGTLSLILPCDPGLAWRIGRFLGPRRRAEAAGLPYDYFMAREHINSIFNLKQLVAYHLPNRIERWWPTGLAQPDINLIYCVNAIV